MRNVLFAFGTFGLSLLVIGNAYLQKKQFYPSVVYITKSNPSMAVMYIQALVVILLLGKLMRKIFFGELRAAEIEHLIERFWYAVTETCLAFTVFKDDFSPKFVALFTLLLFLKSFHWLAEDRVDYMERSPIISWLFHTRIVLLLTLLGMLDLYFISVAYHHTVTKGASVQLVFGFEYAILLTVIVNTAIKYILHIIDMNREVFWENKAVFLLYVEVLIGLVKVGLYMCFVALMIKLYTLPLFAFRPMYYAMRNFKTALNDVIQSRRAIRNMNTLYPDATAEELAAADNVCIICREEMQAGAKKLPCNHIFHVSCLRSWFQRHQTCPTCRLNVLRTTPETQSANAVPVQPQIPPQNNGIPPMFAFPAWQPPFFPLLNPNLQQPNAAHAEAARTAQQQQQQQPQQQQPSQQQTQTNTSYTQGFTEPRLFNNQSTSSTNSPSFTPPMSMPFMLPSMPPFIPCVTTPPLPPRDWSGLSMEELKQMEDAGRKGVEARLQCLRNIHTLMDASVILMQQYVTSATIAAAASMSASNVASQNDNSESKRPPESSSSGINNNSQPSTSQSTAFNNSQSFSPTFSTQFSDNKSTDVSSASKDVLDTNVNTSNETDIRHESSTSDNNDLNSNGQEEIRRRRVQKFSNTSENTS